MSEQDAQDSTTAALLAQLKHDAKAREEKVRAMLTPAQRAEFDAGMEEIRSGRHALRMLWHSLSEPQRRTVKLLEDGRRRLIRCRHQPSLYDAHGEPYAVSGAARTTTVRVLVRHGVLHWTGLAEDRELRAELAARGHALLAVLRDVN